MQLGPMPSLVTTFQNPSGTQAKPGLTRSVGLSSIPPATATHGFGLRLRFWPPTKLDIIGLFLLALLGLNECNNHRIGERNRAAWQAEIKAKIAKQQHAYVLRDGYYRSGDTTLYRPVEARLDTILHDYMKPGNLTDNQDFVQIFAPDFAGGVFQNMLHQYKQDAEHNPQALEALQDLYDFATNIAIQTEVLAPVKEENPNGYYAAQTALDEKNKAEERESPFSGATTNNITVLTGYHHFWEEAVQFFPGSQ